MAEQIILNTDLYDNLLTERKGDYTAKPHITGTLYNTDIAARIVAARTSTNTARSSTSSTWPTAIRCRPSPRARAWWTAWANTSSTCRGPSRARRAQFEPGKHALGITYTMGKLFARDPQAGEGGGERRGGRRSGDQYRDRLHLQGHQRAAPSSGGALVLGGVNLKIQGDDPPSVSTSPPPPKGPRR